jgi:hypothetical protein
MALYVCYRLTYSRHRIGTETFEAGCDADACGMAAKLVARGNWLDRELWTDGRCVICPVLAESVR